jgi:hypothetical protein
MGNGMENNLLLYSLVVEAWTEKEMQQQQCCGF